MRKDYVRVLAGLLVAAGIIQSAACSGEDGKDGAPGERGADGERGAPGAPGAPGMPGENGAPGAPGRDGKDGNDGIPGEPGGSSLGGSLARPPGVDPSAPLSSVVALSLKGSTGAKDIPEYVKSLVAKYAKGATIDGQFPLLPAATDHVRAIGGLVGSVVVKWLDPLTFSPGGPRFGANVDYLAYFGDGWNETTGDPPQFHGRGDAGWLWANHEYVSGSQPTSTSPPNGQHLTLAKLFRFEGTVVTDPTSPTWIDSELVKYVRAYKKEVGGSWIRIVQDPASLVWSVDMGASNVRYDGTSNTLLKVTGTSVSPDHDDDGAPLPTNVATGIAGDCAGGTTPWGTIFTAEENVQDFYGDVEACWDSDQKLVAGRGCDAGGAIALTLTPSTSASYGMIPDPNQRHARDLYGYLSEIDPGVAPSEYDGKTVAGTGHKKIGALGRARWEGATFAVDGDWKLMNDEPIVIYAGDDRRGGRIFKFVTKNKWTTGMTKAQTRALLDEGTLYVAHFAGIDNADGYKMLADGKPPTEAARGNGKWIKLSVDSTDIAPNAAALGDATKTVGAALQDPNWNRLGAFATDDDVRRALFTACNKIGIMELNRPEDIEWNPKAPGGKAQLFVAFTNHGRKMALDQDGRVFDPATHSAQSPTRSDAVGAIFAIEEANPSSPGTSTTFTFFQVWGGSKGSGEFDAANPDNIVIDAAGGVWFGTDGNFGTNKHADALYYLDLDPAHKAGQSGVVNASHGKAFRVVASPSDAEATGPAFSSDMRTLFFGVQHPGEDAYSVWP